MNEKFFGFVKKKETKHCFYFRLGTRVCLSVCGLGREISIVGCDVYFVGHSKISGFRDDILDGVLAIFNS